jgi:hypothetical protein
MARGPWVVLLCETTGTPNGARARAGRVRDRVPFDRR